ncbi:MAG: bifunctional precorrin-2 dehydrogenase/sirohydrochlorin ferrochelatase [Ilumatobacteraceae bacterium]
MQFPVNLNLAGRRCLLVGAGRIGLRKARQLVACGADVTVVAPDVVDGFEELGVTIVRRAWRVDDLAGIRLVITATGDTDVDQQVFDASEERGIWVNSADDPDRCSFTLPAVVRRGPVQVTVSTGGASPALASWLRSRLDDLLGPEFADVAHALAELRAEIHSDGRSTEDTDWQPIVSKLVAERVPTRCPALVGVGAAGTTSTSALRPLVTP